MIAQMRQILLFKLYCKQFTCPALVDSRLSTPSWISLRNCNKDKRMVLCEVLQWDERAILPKSSPADRSYSCCSVLYVTFTLFISVCIIKRSLILTTKPTDALYS